MSSKTISIAQKCLIVRFVMFPKNGINYKIRVWLSMIYYYTYIGIGHRVKTNWPRFKDWAFWWWQWTVVQRYTTIHRRKHVRVVFKHDNILKPRVTQRGEIILMSTAQIKNLRILGTREEVVITGGSPGRRRWRKAGRVLPIITHWKLG